MAGSVADPQASALARLTGAEEGTIRSGIALLLTGLIEVGSALGFLAGLHGDCTQPAPLRRLVMWRVHPARRIRSTTAFDRARGRRASAGSQTRHKATGSRGHGSCASCPLAGPRNGPPRPAPGSVPGLQVRSHTKLQLSSRANPIDRSIQTRLSMDHAGNIPARDAYADFCRWARAMDIEPGSETRFGRDFSARIIGLGGVKVKRRDRAYYHGVALAAQKLQVPLALRLRRNCAQVQCWLPWRPKSR